MDLVSRKSTFRKLVRGPQYQSGREPWRISGEIAFALGGLTATMGMIVVLALTGAWLSRALPSTG